MIVDETPPEPGPDDIPIEFMIRALQQTIADQAWRIALLEARLAYDRSNGELMPNAPHGAAVA